MRLLLLTMIVVILSKVDAFAGSNGMGPIKRITSIPTLSEWGMIATFVILGIVGFIALKKRLAANSSR